MVVRRTAVFADILGVMDGWVAAGFPRKGLDRFCGRRDEWCVFSECGRCLHAPTAFASRAGHAARIRNFASGGTGGFGGDVRAGGEAGAGGDDTGGAGAGGPELA